MMLLREGVRMSDVDIESKASKVDGDSSKAQREKLDRIREQQAADRAAAGKASSAAETAAKAVKAAAKTAADSSGSKSRSNSKSDTESDLGKELLAGGAAALGSALEGGMKAAESNRKAEARRKRRSGGDSSSSGAASGLNWKKLLVIVVIAAVIIGVVIAAWPTIAMKLGLTGDTTVAADISQDQVMTTTTIDWNDAILKEARQEQELVVWEQDVQVDTQVSSELASLAIFRKTKVVHSYGTGVYAVDLSQITDDSITVDDSARTVTIAIPRTHLRYITKDLDKTEFEDTDHAILAFGDLKLTQEQQSVLERSIEDAMRTELTTDDEYAQADDAALLMVYDTYQPVIARLSDQYTLDIVFADGSSNADDSGNTYQSDTTTSGK